MATEAADPTTPHRVRIAPRARRISLRLHPDGELEIVLPHPLPDAEIAELLHRKRRWLRNARARLAERRAVTARSQTLDALELRAIGRRWRIQQDTGFHGVAVADTDTLRVGGPAEHVHEGLRRWLLASGREHLAPWLDAVAAEIGIAYTGLTLRTQRGRWGSCSSRGRINLNASLLFLPPALVRHVMIHELCHRRHLNHSPAFWALVARHDPDYANARLAMRNAWRYVPGWLSAHLRCT